MRARPGLRAAAGFTLIEMIVVLAVLGFMLGIVLTRGPQRSARLELDGAAREVATALRAGRATAIARDRPVLVAIDLEAHAYRIGDAAPRALPKDFPLALKNAVGATPAGAGGIRFLPDGSSSGGRVEIAQGARKVLVGVDWLTGRVSVADGS